MTRSLTDSDDKKSNGIAKIIFRISLFIYPVTLMIAVILGCFAGIDSGWAMPAWSDGELMYGIDAIQSYLIIFIMRFWYLYLAIILFQAGYIICSVISKYKK